MKRFDYIRPGNMEDAIAALKANEEPCLLAGGTDLLIGMKTKTVKPKCLVDLKGIPGLNGIECDQGFKLGALTTVRDVEVSSLIREKLPALSQAAVTLGSIQIRNRATVGGNLCHGSPAADMSAMLLAMNSQLKIATGNGDRTIEIDQFFSAPNRTVLNRNEILSQIIIPEEIEKFKGIYLKHGPRKAMDIGIVNIAILLDADAANGVCNQIMIALGAVAPRPIRARKAEALLNGAKLSPKAIQKAATAAAGESTPITDLSPKAIQKAATAAAGESTPITDFRASAGYRKDLVENMVVRGIEQILNSNHT
jgi:carbon-monoxide dehydrogenase medium subunit